MLRQACFSCSGNSYSILSKKINNNSDIVFLTQKLSKNLRSSVKIYELITSKLNEIYKEIFYKLGSGKININKSSIILKILLNYL